MTSKACKFTLHYKLLEAINCKINKGNRKNRDTDKNYKGSIRARTQKEWRHHDFRRRGLHSGEETNYTVQAPSYSKLGKETQLESSCQAFLAVCHRKQVHMDDEGASLRELFHVQLQHLPFVNPALNYLVLGSI